MAGVKGRSGGGRPNTGGARPGAGRKPKVVAPIVVDNSADPQKFLLDLMNDQSVDPRMRLDAAKALMPFMHGKLGANGKKEEKQAAAKKATAGKFAPAAPPRLVVNNK